MRIFYAAAAVMVMLTPSQSFAYDLIKSIQDRDDCSGKGTTFPTSIVAACSRLIENIDGPIMPGLKDDLDLYYLYRGLTNDELKKKPQACADLTKALELMPQAKVSRKKWFPLANRVKTENCGG